MNAAHVRSSSTIRVAVLIITTHWATKTGLISPPSSSPSFPPHPASFLHVYSHFGNIFSFFKNLPDVQQAIEMKPGAKFNNRVWLTLLWSSSNSCQLLLGCDGRSANLLHSVKYLLLTLAMLCC